MTFAYTVDLFTVLVVVTAVLAIVGGAIRARRGGALPIVVVVLGVLLGISQLVVLPFGTVVVALLLGIALVLDLVLGSQGRRGSRLIAAIALVLDVTVLLGSLGVLRLPGQL